ncbi:MAG: hypothetical protein M3342_03510 [Bacteroidota bacterium]|nr:hypothetical protein [Flavisolibacter sp.]MBD0349743.1 hypothetical protein [Flavisolibacter sp.]MBD0368359.1 hypothetical protein [Flavisolibacter sp.]MBD0376528.1 hypothetical protein [Flavisolibacter sp.]MDQ3843066.1 hypothetical protein [Bacteroidota bacterium]
MKQLMVVFDFPTASEQQYKAAWDAIRASGHANPKGLIFHVGASKPDGGMMITDVWESEQAFNEFSKVLMPIIAQQGFPQTMPLMMPVSYVYEANAVGTMQ